VIILRHQVREKEKKRKKNCQKFLKQNCQKRKLQKFCSGDNLNNDVNESAMGNAATSKKGDPAENGLSFSVF
jgi:hypothetical protein